MITRIPVDETMHGPLIVLRPSPGGSLAILPHIGGEVKRCRWHVEACDQGAGGSS